MWNFSYRTYNTIRALPLAGIIVELYFFHFICLVSICKSCCEGYIYKKTDAFLKNCSRQYFSIPNGPFNKLMTGADVIRDSSNRLVRKRVYQLVGSYVITSIWHALTVAWNVLVIAETRTCDQRYDCFASHNRSMVEAVDCTQIAEDTPVHCLTLVFNLNQALASAGGIITIFALILTGMGYLCRAMSSTCGGRRVKILRYVILVILWMIYLSATVFFGILGIVLVQLLLDSAAYMAAVTFTLLIPWGEIFEEKGTPINNESTGDSEQKNTDNSDTPEIVTLV